MDILLIINVPYINLNPVNNSLIHLETIDNRFKLLISLTAITNFNSLLTKLFILDTNS